MAWFGPLLPGSAQQQASGEPPPTSVLSTRAAVSATITAAWSVVRSLHPEPVWAAQTTRKLVQPFIAPAVNNPPFSSRHTYAGEWPAVSWDTQRRATLQQPFVQPVDAPPFSSRHSYSGEWPGLSWDAQTRPRLIQGGGAITADNPPVCLYGGRIYQRYAEYWNTPPHYQWRMVWATESGEPPEIASGTTWRPIWGRRRRGV